MYTWARAALLSAALLYFVTATYAAEPHTVSRVLVDLRHKTHAQEKAPSSDESPSSTSEINEIRAGKGLEDKQLAAVLHSFNAGSKSSSKEENETQQSTDGGPEKLGDSTAREDSTLPYSSYELVLARVNEEIPWIAELPEFWKITVYNKGGEGNPVPEVQNRTFDVVDLPNVGREGETFMHHIWLRYNSLSDYTVFSQAIPFVHSPYFVDLLKDAGKLKEVQCLSLFYIAEGNPEYVTPREVVETYRKEKGFRSERLSLRTLDSIYYNDRGSATVGRQYLEEHHLPAGTNIIAHFLSRMGLPGWIPPENEIGSFGYGALVGVHKSKIVQHPVHVYENLSKDISNSAVTGFVMEKTYMMLFGGPDVHD